MLVSKRMRKEPVTVGSQDYLATVQKKMKEGGFRRMPVVENGRLVGIVTDKDLRQHLGYLEPTKVNVAMSEKLVTVLPKNTLEEASQLLLKHKIGGLQDIAGGGDPHQLPPFDHRQAANLVFEQGLRSFL